LVGGKNEFPGKRKTQCAQNIVEKRKKKKVAEGEKKRKKYESGERRKSGGAVL